MHGAGKGLFFRWCEEYPAVHSECAAHELYRVQSELGSILSWVSIELKGCTWKQWKGCIWRTFSDGAGCGQLPQGVLASSGLAEWGIRLFILGVDIFRVLGRASINHWLA